MNTFRFWRYRIALSGALSLALVVSLTPGLSLAATGDLFMQSTRYAAGEAPVDIATADFNDDGKADLVTVNEDGLSVSILLGNGDGTFQDAAHYGAGTTGPQHIAVGDFNGDEAPDLVVTNYADDILSILLNNGDGTFQSPTTRSTGDGPDGIATADLNNDDILDLAVTLIEADLVAVLLGNGNGTFQAGVTYATGEAPTEVVIANLNAGAAPDLAVTNNDTNDISILLGNGNGTFQAKVDYATGGDPAAIVAVDLDNDDVVDLAAVARDDGNVNVLLGNGDGTFQTQVPYNAASQGIAAGDVNGDGVQDLVAASGDSGAVGVLLGLGDGTFREEDQGDESGLGYGTDLIASDVVVADFDDNGVLDLAASTGENDTVSVLLGNGDGTFYSDWNYASYGGSPFSLVVSDFNLDHKRDVAVVNYEESLAVFLGDPSLTGIFRVSNVIGGFDPGSVDIAADTLNGDAYPDLAITHEDEDILFLYMGIGDGTFDEGSYEEYPTGSEPQSLVIDDFDGDHDKDIAVTERDDDTVSVFLNNDDGTFPARVAYSVGGGLRDIIATDFNDDNYLDLAMASNEGTGGFYLLLGNGDGTFRAAVNYPTTMESHGIATADFDRDGNKDIVVTNNTTDVVSVFLGNGDGTFQPRVDHNVGGESMVTVATADFNGDGCMDFAVYGDDVSEVTVRLGNCDGTFQETLPYFVGNAGMTLIAADINDDNKPDLLFPELSGGLLSILINVAPPTSRHSSIGGGSSGGSSGGSGGGSASSPDASDVPYPPTTPGDVVSPLPSSPSLFPTFPSDPATLQKLVDLLTQLLTLLQAQLEAQ